MYIVLTNNDFLCRFEVKVMDCLVSDGPGHGTIYVALTYNMVHPRDDLLYWFEV